MTVEAEKLRDHHSVARSARTLFAFISIALSSAGCGSSGTFTDAGRLQGAGQPLERANRAVFEFNEGFDQTVVQPVVSAYSAHVPKPVRNGVRNLVANVNEPMNAANLLLQGEVERSAQSVMRFTINTTIGLGGFFDHAATAGLAPNLTSFDETLGTWGIPTGEYLVLPVLGPSTPRKILSDVTEGFVDPLNRLPIPYAGSVAAGRSMASGALKRIEVDADLQTLREDSLDLYERMKSLYMQKANSHPAGQTY